MTRTVRKSLGSSSLSGKHAIDLTQRFRDQLLSLYPKPAGVSLVPVSDVEAQSRGVVAVYDADDVAAVAWIRRVEKISGELWQRLADRRKGVRRE